MNKLDELVNDYCLLGDDGAIIFPSFDGLLDFIEEIRAEEREECAKVCDLVAREIDDTNGTATYCANAIRARGER